ncbi:hypothetical protein [Azospirillum soli]|uniref:hypothetical protein n=1 Tax=Azospirillum soli TaxID=1304799 RepID=UPI001AE118B6|nr:hypothetical protein [Azospirillum soli]MBP2315560.1 uracil-DNA glycosylase [Azospirillum soli]
MGFAIFYSPPRESPPLLICGINPSNFDGRNAPLDGPNNRAMLSGRIPETNSYLNNGHLFGERLMALFDRDLIRSAVGMNVWHFQAVANADKAPKDLRRNCEERTLRLIRATRPAAVLALGMPLLKAMDVPVHPMPDTRAAKRAEFHGIPVFYLSHPTGAHTRHDATHDAPVVHAAIKRVL